MLNFTAIYPHPRVRPFLTAGAGLVRVRAMMPGEPSVGQTEAGWSAGGGTTYFLNDALGFRVDVRYFRQFGRQDAIPLGTNGVLDFFRWSVGATYAWPLK
jgi:opacity protein-like surface antigen